MCIEADRDELAEHRAAPHAQTHAEHQSEDAGTTAVELNDDTGSEVAKKM